MLVNAKEYWKKIIEWYLIDGYNFYGDPDLTFQEFVLIEHIKPYATADKQIDLDMFNDADKDVATISSWKEMCLAHYFQPIIIDKPWNQVLIQKERPSNEIIKSNGLIQSWKECEPYKTWYEKEMSEKNEKIKKWEEEKAKKRDYQRRRRAKIKGEKEKNNVK